MKILWSVFFYFIFFKHQVPLLVDIVNTQQNEFSFIFLIKIYIISHFKT